MTIFGVDRPDRLSGSRSASEAVYIRAVAYAQALRNAIRHYLEHEDLGAGHGYVLRVAAGWPSLDDYDAVLADRAEADVRRR